MIFGFSLQRMMLGLLLATAVAGLARAQDSAAPAALKIELNAAQDTGEACRISFMVENRLGVDLGEAVFEAVLFDASGRVDRLTLFDFRDLPQGRPRVRQFQIDGQGCAAIGRILINGAQTCTGEGVAEGDCMDRLELQSRTDIELIG